MSRPSSTGSSRRGRAARAPVAAARAAAPAGRWLHLDAFSGAAGNMFLAALLELGLDRRALESDLRGLGVPFRLRVEAVQRGALGATWLDVEVPRRTRPRAGRVARKGHDHGHASGHGRHYAEIRRLLERARLEAPVRSRALAIFEALAGAEARVHRVPIGKVHFHEVGAVDAIVDVTGAAIGLHRLGITGVSCSPVALGHGSVEAAHGRLPLPAPAALELLRGVPVVPAHVEWETVTPTGAAILRTVVDAWTPLPAMTVEAVGHGAGNDRPGPMPNLLRAVLGTRGGPVHDRVALLETHLDDLVPEHFEHLMERLLEAGALDVSLLHLHTKKSRPGFALRVVARPADRLPLARILFAESTALGVRVQECDRLVLARAERRVRTRFGTIRVKRVQDWDGGVEVSAEYEDCRRAARRHDAPLREVIREAEDAARRLEGDDGR